MTVHVTMPNMYKVPGYGIDGFTADQIVVGKTYRLISDGGNALERQVMGINEPYKGRLQLLRIKEQDTIHVTTDAFVKVMRGRGVQG
ncbi:hypothetical protein D3C74_241590 [compost metagenome]